MKYNNNDDNDNNDDDEELNEVEWRLTVKGAFMLVLHELNYDTDTFMELACETANDYEHSKPTFLN